MTTKLWAFKLLGAVAILVFIIYPLLIQPWHVRWGASDAEVMMTLPGDEFLPEPKLLSTRAITINASAAEIWPWLLQLGQGRGGMYSYTWLENLFGANMHNADTILPEFQNLKVSTLR